MAIGAIIGGIIAAGGAVAASAASGGGDPPDYGAATRAGIEADIETLPLRRKIEAAAKIGGTVLKEGYRKVKVSANQALQQAQVRLQQAEANMAQRRAYYEQAASMYGIRTGPQAGAPGTATTIGNAEVEARLRDMSEATASYQNAVKELEAIKAQTPDGTGEVSIYVDPSGNAVPKQEATHADFEGLGETDVQREYSRAMAQTQLDLSKEFGEQYIAQRRKELQLADPEGWAARQRMFQDIMGEADRLPDTKMQETLAGQLQGELEAGARLDPELAREAQQGIRGAQIARGQTLGNAASFQEAMEVGSAAENRRRGRQQAALQFLTSGATPEDVKYRRRQQNLGNLGNFLTGQTPTAQFNQLSGGQQGTAPMLLTDGFTGLNPNAGAQGASFALNRYNMQQQQPDHWLNAIGLGFRGADIGRQIQQGRKQGSSNRNQGGMAWDTGL